MRARAAFGRSLPVVVSAASVLVAATLAPRVAWADDAPAAPSSIVSAPSAPSAAPPAPPAPPPRACPDGACDLAGPSHVAVRTKLVQLTLSGYVQADWVVARQSSSDELDPATRQPLNQDRFLLRRGHIRVDAERGFVTSALEIDANTVNGPVVRPVVADVSLRWPGRPRRGEEPYIEATAGLFKTPFGFELLEADNVRPFLERATAVNAFFPGAGYDLGLRLQGGYRFLDYALGIMNGDPLGERTFAGQDPNKSKDLVYRAGAHADPRPWLRVEAGFSQVTGAGFHAGDPPTKDTLVWRDVNEDGVVQPTEIQVIEGSSATPSERFRRFALGGDLRVMVKVPVLGQLALRGEILRGTNLDRGVEPADPVATGRDLRELGYSAGFVQELTRWGYAGVRYDRYDADADAVDQLGAGQVLAPHVYSTWAFTGALRYDIARLVVEYDHRQNPLGRDASGATTTLKDDALTLRAQVSF